MTITLSSEQTRSRALVARFAGAIAARIARIVHPAASRSAAELQRLDDRGLADVGLTGADVRAHSPIEATARTLDEIVTSVGRIHYG